MKLGMGPLFDMLYPKKWSNSVRRTVWPAKPEICPAIFFHVFSRFGSFGVDLEKKFSTKIFDQKKLRKISELTAWCQIFSWKVFFGQNFLVEKKISKSTPNDPKGEKNGRRSNSVRRTDRTDRSAKPATVFFSRFGSFGVIKTEKNGRRSNSVRRTVRPADRSAKPATFFHVLDY